MSAAGTLDLVLSVTTHHLSISYSFTIGKHLTTIQRTQSHVFWQRTVVSASEVQTLNLTNQTVKYASLR